jgi:benzoylformate decarboxylase
MTAAGLAVAALPTPEGSTVRSVTFDLLRALGLTTIFGNPGSTELPMLRDLPADFRYILGLQESVVVAMADGFAQASRHAALVNLHSSAGVGHAMGNLFTAYRNGTPLVVTAGQQARSILPYEPFLFAERATEFPRPFVKWAAEPARAEDVPLAIARAFHIAMQAPCGPTFVSVPIDDWDRPCAPVVAARVSRQVRADEALLAEAADLLAAAQRPVVVAGAGVADAAVREALRELAERHAAPVWVAPMAARNPFPEDHPLFRGFLPASREAIVDRLGNADLVLVVGAPVFTFHVEGFGPFVPNDATLIQIVDDPAMAARTPLGLAIAGNIADALATLNERAPPQRSTPMPRVHVEAPAADRLTDALVMARLQAIRPKGIAIVEEAPSTRGPMHDHLPVLAGEEFHTCASGGLGHGLPAAVGVALAQPDRTVLCLIGDGSAMYAIQGLWSAAQLGADVRFLVINNGGYAALDQFAALFGMTMVGSKLPGVDFVALANGQGVPAMRISAVPELDSALETLFSGTGPRLLEVVVATADQKQAEGERP